MIASEPPDGSRCGLCTDHGQVAQDRKKNFSGQMTLFDFMDEEEKQAFEIHYPDVGEYE